MAWLRRFFILIVAGLCGVVTSQFPEFAQQYRQRLGGALDEMRQVVADFDADAAKNGLTRETALQTYARSIEQFLRDRGLRMSDLIRRFKSLSVQKAVLEGTTPLMRPIVVLRSPDERVMRGAWTDFQPAVPVTPAGFVWASFGFFGGALLCYIIVGGVRRLIFGRPRRTATSCHPATRPT